MKDILVVGIDKLDLARGIVYATPRKHRSFEIKKKIAPLAWLIRYYPQREALSVTKLQEELGIK